jgi:hypothetical protein
MCAAAVEGQQATWITVNIADDSAGSVSVKYGRFTGQTMTTEKGHFRLSCHATLLKRFRILKPGES